MEKRGGSGAFREVGCSEMQTEGRWGHLLKAVWGMRFNSLHQGSLGLGFWGRKEKEKGALLGPRLTLKPGLPSFPSRPSRPAGPWKRGYTKELSSTHKALISIKAAVNTQCVLDLTLIRTLPQVPGYRSKLQSQPLPPSTATVSFCCYSFNKVL